MPCPSPSTTNACTSGARARRWRAANWPAALAAIRKMPPAQRSDSRWQYFEARLAEKTGNASEAQRLYRAAATSATFHGFLAADRLKQPYALCPWEPNGQRAGAGGGWRATRR